MSDTETYDFSLIFKGLFRCVPDPVNQKMTVLLVDARSPKKNSEGDALRDHRAVIEFHLADWRNKPTDPIVGLVEVNKRNKGEMGIYLLNRQDIRLSVTDGEATPELTFVEDNSPNSFLNLPRIDTISPGSGQVAQAAIATGDGCLARVLDIDRGIVTSERQSRFRDQILHWAYAPTRRREVFENFMDHNVQDPDKTLLQQALETAGEVNLDVRITAKVPKGAAIRLDPSPFPNDGVPNPDPFILRPEEGKDLEVWFKNRELDMILVESDQPGADEGCVIAEFADFDFELLYSVSASPGQKIIPYRSDSFDTNNPVSAGGCACGGCV